MSERGPLYQHIEFWRSAKTLWAKLESGHWDWLGRKPDGQFVLGRPRRQSTGLTPSPLSVKSVAPGATEGQHGVRVYNWRGQPTELPNSGWYTEPAQAKENFEEMVRRLEDPKQSPILARVVLIEHGQVTDERFVVQVPLPNYQ